MKTKTFDCVEMKRRAQEKIRAALKACSREQEIAFFQQGAEEFRKRVKLVRQGAKPDAKHDLQQ